VFIYVADAIKRQKSSGIEILGREMVNVLPPRGLARFVIQRGNGTDSTGRLPGVVWGGLRCGVCVGVGGLCGLWWILFAGASLP